MTIDTVQIWEITVNMPPGSFIFLSTVTTRSVIVPIHGWKGMAMMFSKGVASCSRREFFKWTTAEFTGTWRSLGMTAPQNSAAVTEVTFHSTHPKGYQNELLLFSVYGNSSQLTTRVEYFAIIRSRLIAECFVFIFYFNATAADMKKFRVSAYSE